MSQSLNLLAVFFWKVFIDSHISKPLISREWLIPPSPDFDDRPGQTAFVTGFQRFVPLFISSSASAPEATALARPVHWCVA